MSDGATMLRRLRSATPAPAKAEKQENALKRAAPIMQPEKPKKSASRKTRNSKTTASVVSCAFGCKIPGRMTSFATGQWGTYPACQKCEGIAAITGTKLIPME